MPTPGRRAPGARLRRSAAGWLLSGLALAACATPAPPPPEPPPGPCPALDAPVHSSAQQGRIHYLEREVERLEADLRQAEEAMVAAESGLRSAHSRADAVSTLAEARIALQRGSAAAPWRRDEIREGRDKLEEAEQQLGAGRPGSAVFFASRALRIAETLQDDAARVARERHARFVRGARVNLREGPSTEERVLAVVLGGTPVFEERAEGDWVLVRTLDGPAGWIHAPLLQER